MTGTKRGTSNGNSSGSAEDRRRRRKWLLETYAADMALVTVTGFSAPHVIPLSAVPVYIEAGDIVEPCCRCYRCGKLLTLETLTVDRIKPGRDGGTYRRSNIRPACSTCNEKTGGSLGGKTTAARRVSVVRPRVRQLAARDTQPGSGTTGAVSVPDVQASGPGSVRRDGEVA